MSDVQPASTPAQQLRGTDSLFNPQDPRYIANPYPTYARMREEAPVHCTPSGTYVVTRHADISSMLRDKRFGKDFVGRMTRRYGVGIMDEPVFRSMGHWMALSDPPVHTRLRGLVVSAFSARRVEAMRQRIQEVVDACIARAEPAGQIDLVNDFALQFSLILICDVLGIPQDRRHAFYSHAAALARFLDPLPLSRAELDAGNKNHLEMDAFFEDLFELRRREPANDLITTLVQAEEDGSRLTNEELMANVMFLFGAGHETTVNLIGNGLYALLSNPSQLALLKENPSLIGGAIDEFLRYDSPVQFCTRTTLAAVECCGVKIPQGALVLCVLGSGNRDPAAFENPDRLDVLRKDVRPLSFGGGIHYCLGAQMGRLEAEIAISTLLARCPNLTLTAPDDVEWRPMMLLRGLTRLPATW